MWKFIEALLAWFTEPDKPEVMQATEINPIKPAMTPDQIFATALSFTLRAEGGYSDSTLDPGGRTDAGVTQVTYSAWLKTKNLPDDTVAHITSEQVQQIYKDNYWTAFHLDQIASFAPITAIALFDFSVNIWDVRAIEMMQRRLGVPVDGKLGPATFHALHVALISSSDLAFAHQYNKDRIAWYEANSKPVFLHGLTNRVNNLDEFLDTTFSQ